LLQQLDGRAIGLWRVDADRLVQLGFLAPPLDAALAERFAAATASVSRDQIGLAIVKAAEQRKTVVSMADQLPAETGSGYWLRAFGTERSVAVPLQGASGDVCWVLSIALGRLPGEGVITELFHEAARSHLLT